MTHRKVSEIIPATDGLFSKMPDTIWGEDFPVDQVDIDFIVQSGELFASPLLTYFSEDLDSLADYLFKKYERDWQRIFDAVFLEYNIGLTSTLTETIARENQSSREYLRENDLTRTETAGEDSSTTGTSSTEDNRNTEYSSSGEASNLDSRYGIGASPASPDTQTDSESSSTSAEDETSQVDVSTTNISELERTVSGSENADENFTENVEDQFSEVRTQEGSSPLRTFQALIWEELAGRSGGGWNFIELLFRDVRKEISIPIWPHSRVW